MGYSFSTIEPNQLGQVTKWDVPLNDWIGLKFQNGHNDTLGSAISRATEDFIWDDNNPASPDVLNRAFGIEGQLKFDKPMSAQRAQLMHDRKRKELEAQAYLESASHSWHSAKAAIGFGASLVGGLSHPVDLGLSFLPFVGSEKAATEVAALGGSAWKQALARGAVTEEALLASRIPGGRLTAAFIDGTVSQAIQEIPIAIQKHREQANYTLADSAFNIVAGGAFAGAIKGLGLALEKAARLWREADPRMREAMLTDTLRSVATDEPPQAHWAFGMDEAAIREKVNERVRAENPFVESVPPKQGEQPLTGLPDRELEAIAQKEARGIELTPQEQGKVESLIDPATPNAHPEYNQRVAQIESELGKPTLTESEREQSVNDYLTAAKASHEAKIQGLVDAETRKVIDEVKRQSPPLPKEQVDRYQFKSVPDEKNVAAINEDTASVQQAVLNLATTPEARQKLEAEIKAGLKELEEQPKADKAIKEMIPCVTERAKK